MAVCCLLSACGCLLATGCNSGQQLQRDLYARELRLQEDEIYRLEDCNREYQQIVRSLRKELQELKQGEGGVAVGPKAEKLDDSDLDGGQRSLLDNFDWSPDRPSDANTPAPEPPKIDPPAADTLPEVETPDVELPSIDLGEPTEAPSFAPPSSTTPPAPSPSPGQPSAPATATPSLPATTTAQPALDNTLPAIEVPPLPGAAEPIAPPLPEAAPLETPPTPGGKAPRYEPLPLSRGGGSPHGENRYDESIETAGSLLDEPLAEALLAVDSLALAVRKGPIEATDEATLVVLVQPRDAAGRATLFQGEAAMLLRDPSRDLQEATLVRWDFSGPEVSSAWRDVDREPVLDFAVVTPGDIPTDRPLELWVRLIDAAGNKTLAKANVVIDQLSQPTKQRALEAIATGPLPPPPAAVPSAAVAATSDAEPSEATRTDGWASRSSGSESASDTPAATGWRGSSPDHGSDIRVTSYEETADAE
ncbi:MAG: hypothetical protein AAF589_04465 [Planctomycetota bacterium]